MMHAPTFDFRPQAIAARPLRPLSDGQTRPTPVALQPSESKLVPLEPRAVARLRGAFPDVLRQVPSRVPASATGSLRKSPSNTQPARLSPAKQALAQAIQRASRDSGVLPEFAVGIAKAESSLNPLAKSFDGLSEGTFQMIDSAKQEIAHQFERGTVTRPRGDDDVALGVAYIRHLDDLFREPTRLHRGLATVAIHDPAERRQFVAAAFNSGQGRVASAQARASAAGRDPTRYENIAAYLPTITQRYVPRVLGYTEEASHEGSATARSTPLSRRA